MTQEPIGWLMHTPSGKESHLVLHNPKPQYGVPVYTSEQIRQMVANNYWRHPTCVILGGTE